MTSSPFRKILIANRGEIALRVMRTARALGYRTVAVFSTADADAEHVQRADQALCIGEPLPRQSYLNIEAIIAAARRSGADAVHPGYGFLAENADFASACRAAGLVFIGPSPEAIRAMGDKAQAKRLMSEAGVPVVPGYQGTDQSDKRLAEEAARIGYPVMIKATAGGGGRGMRLVESAAEFPELLQRAQSEAANAFGNGTVILERAIIDPRHIEIQVFGDRYGNAIHLGERDCSVQRRHQKLIEEAPSPAVSPELRARMGAAAVAAVKAIRYEGAGTLEFLLDREGWFYFMEMNTRLQVEHPVTEVVTGLDLVELQLRIAAGEALPLTQEQVRIEGHAIEVRLCAEDTSQGFMPQSGTMALWRMPHELRVEQALHSGAEIPPFYDSMIAKLIASGRTRDEARRKLANGLENAVALGVATNQRFLADCLLHPVFAAGGATTAFIGSHGEALSGRDAEADARAVALAALLLVETAKGAPPRGGGRRLINNLPLLLRFEIDKTRRDVTLTQLGHGHYEALVDGRMQPLRLLALHGHDVRFACDELIESAAWVREGPRLLLGYRGRAYEVEDRTRPSSARREGSGASDGKLRAAMNGRIVAVRAAVGQRVQAGEPVMTLEAMKMEHLHVAPVTGIVKLIHVAPGDHVTSQKLVAEIEPEVGAEPA